MKIIYYHRYAKSGFHIHAFSSANMFFIPDENVILVKEQIGTFGGQVYSISENPEILKEAHEISKGKIPKVENVTIADIEEFEFNDQKLNELIQNAKLKSEVEIKVEKGIEMLLEKVN